MTGRPSRRGLLEAGAASSAVCGLTVLFGPRAAQGEETRTAPATGSAARLDNWVRIAPDGRITVFTGKAELGQGLSTAIAQLAAEGLRVPLSAVTLVTADTARTPDERITAGSHSVDTSGANVLAAALHARELMIAHAARSWRVATDQVVAEGGRIRGPGGHSAGYGEIAAAMDRSAPVRRLAAPPPPRPGGAMGRSLPRLDAPAKVCGDEAFIQDLRPQDLVHARVLRPAAQGLRLAAVDTAAVEAMAGVVKIVRRGGFLGVAAEREWQAATALAALEASARWRGEPVRPPPHLATHLQTAPATEVSAARKGAPDGGGPRRLKVRYSRPYLMHGAIGPSCALARFEDGALTLWTHSQGVFVVRDAIARLLGLPPERVRAIHVAGSGCYGHNGADDAACDAALLARELPGRTVRVQWTRAQEHSFEPYGPAMSGEVEAALDADGRVADWSYVVSSNTHVRRPSAPGLLLAARELPDGPPAPPPFVIPMPEGDGHRNSVPIYDFPNQAVTYRLVTDAPVRVSSLRGLGAHLNVIAIEGAMDELATLAATDPVAFRRRHLRDPRALAVIDAAAEGLGWSRGKPRTPGHGRGFAFARYKNLAGYCAVALEVRVDPVSGRVTLGRVFGACDVGQPVTPDGVLNQVEGGIIQALSWTLLEAVQFGPDGQKTAGWLDYPILRFSQLPERLDVRLIARPGEAFLGAGEIAAGPAGAALVNAVSDALGVRVRDLPLTPDRLRAAASTASPAPDRLGSTASGAVRTVRTRTLRPG